MFGTELVKIINHHALPEEVLAKIFLEIKQAPRLPLSPRRLERRYLANCKLDSKITTWLAA